jgi:hypothetical protein
MQCSSLRRSGSEPGDLTGLPAATGPGSPQCAPAHLGGSAHRVPRLREQAISAPYQWAAQNPADAGNGGNLREGDATSPAHDPCHVRPLAQAQRSSDAASIPSSRSISEQVQKICPNLMQLRFGLHPLQFCRPRVGSSQAFLEGAAEVLPFDRLWCWRQSKNGSTCARQDCGALLGVTERLPHGLEKIPRRHNENDEALVP